MSTRLTYQGAVANLERFFKDTSTDYVSVDDIFKAVDRDGLPLEKNRAWLYNKFTSMRSYNLFTKENTVKNHTRVTAGISLTAEGKRALNRDNPTTTKANSASVATPTPTFDTVKADIETLREQFPALEITFEVQLRKEAA